MDSAEEAAGGNVRERRGLSWVAVLGLVLAQWAVAFAALLSYSLPILVAAGVVWTTRRRLWGGLVVLLVSSPLSFSFARGLAAYGNPDATMMSVGLRESGSTFIDRHTRLPVATSGCLVDGDEWIRDWPYNGALHLAVAVLGPPRGHYAGPIPTERQARQALAGTEAVDWRELAHDRVTVGGREVTLERWLGPALIQAYYSFDPLRDDPDSSLAPVGLVHVQLWRESVLLIEMCDPLFDDLRAHVAVVDADSGRVLGHFPGSRSMGSFPLAWRPVGPRTLDMDDAEGPPGVLDR